MGLSRFRAGRPAEALEALDAAREVQDAPERAGWSFNRGACLYALERFTEAEQAFLAATTDASLARIAWVNAGFAALDAGAPERAAQWAERARPGASEREAVLVEELLSLVDQARGLAEDAAAEAYRQGLASFDAGRFEEARAFFLQAAKGSPSPGRALLMAGASAWRLGAYRTAHEELSSALAQPLEPWERRTAYDYLDRLSLGLRSQGQGFRVSGDARLGFDSNVFQVGVAARDVSGMRSTVTASSFAEAGLGLVSRWRLSDTLFAEFAYSGTQQAYALSSAQDYSLQLHRAAVALEWDVARGVRLGASSWGELFFTGLSNFRGLQASVGGSAWFALDENEWTSSRLDVSFAQKDALGSEFSYLTGQRLDATLSQELRLRTVGLTAWYRYREDRIGTLVQAVSGETSREYVIPFAWAGHAVGASARLVLSERWDARLNAEFEWREYLGDSYLRIQGVDGSVEEWGRRRREDTRFALGPSLNIRLSNQLQLSARYEVLVNTSNVDTRLTDPEGACVAPDYLCHRYDYTNGNYQKHVVMLELGATW